jgi:hypothetical protein
MLSRLRSLRVVPSARASGQIIVLFAVFVIVLMVLAGSAYDYASIVVDDARLQNSVDAAVLAGSDALVAYSGLPSATQIVIAQSTAVAYLAANGVATATPGTNVNIAFPASTAAPGATAVPLIENMTITANRSHPNAFWPLVGINSVNLQSVGGAHAARSMLDVVLSLDTTGSLVNSNNLSDFTIGPTNATTVQDAVVAFVNAMNPTNGDPRGPKIGIGRYAGIQCQFIGSGSTMHLYAGGPGDYGGTCTDDETILSPLSNNKANLIQIANGPSSGCPASALYACPIQHHPYMINGGALGIDGDWAGALTQSSGAPYYTGTKEPNAICLVNPADPLCLPSHTPAAVSSTGFAWKAANGARNCQPDGSSWPCPAGTQTNQARRVLIIMTDGQDEAWPSTLYGTTNDPQTTPDYGMPDVNSPYSIPQFDTNFQTLATNLKATQSDGSPGVEIYVVGFFCTTGSYTTGTYPPANFCQSKIAYQTTNPRSCPGPGYTQGQVTGSRIDDILVKVSSSASGTCDHYFPISKSTDSLSGLFQAMAGTISRGQLTQ